jgi:hypothetical protein
MARCGVRFFPGGSGCSCLRLSDRCGDDLVRPGNPRRAPRGLMPELSQLNPARIQRRQRSADAYEGTHQRRGYPPYHPGMMVASVSCRIGRNGWSRRPGPPGPHRRTTSPNADPNPASAFPKRFREGVNHARLGHATDFVKSLLGRRDGDLHPPRREHDNSDVQCTFRILGRS